MSIKQRLVKLEQIMGQADVVDIVSIIHAGRDACRTGIPAPYTPCPPEWETSGDPLKRRIFAARRRVGKK